MADHTIWGSFDGALTQYIRPYIEVNWSQNQVQNTSTVTATLYFHRYTNNYWTYNELTNSNGHSCTFRVGSSTVTQIRPFNLQRSNPPNRVAIWTRTQTIEHNSNGTASVNVSANGTTNVNPDTYSFGESVTLPTIARQTEIDSVSMNNQLRPSTNNSLSISLDRKHSNYTHRFEIMNGSTILQSTTGGLVTSVNVTGTTVNKMIDLMETVKTRNFTLRVVTLSGSTVIGNKTKNFSVTLNDSYTSPVIGRFLTSIIGTGHDNSIGKYVQNISRVRTQFDADYGRGASRQSMSVRVDGRAVSGNMLSDGILYRADSDVLTKSGTITISITATNSRGQSTSDTRDITVHSYRPPTITRFTGYRSDTNPTNVIINRTYTRTSLNGDNLAYPRIERREFGSTSWSTENESSTLSASFTITGNNEATSYEFRMVVYDSFGNEAVAEFSIGTARVLMEKYKDVGISVGQRFDTNNPAVFQVGGDISLRDEQDRTLNLLKPTFIKATLENGWSVYNFWSNDVGYFKVGGLVYVVGMIQPPNSGSPSGTTMFILPEGFRPVTTYVFNATLPSGTYRVDAHSDGRVIWQMAPPSFTWISLNVISFPVGG